MPFLLYIQLRITLTVRILMSGLLSIDYTIILSKLIYERWVLAFGPTPATGFWTSAPADPKHPYHQHSNLVPSNWSRKCISIFTFIGFWEDLACPQINYADVLQIAFWWNAFQSDRATTCSTLDHLYLQSSEHSLVHHWLIISFHPVHLHSVLHQEGWK